VTYSFISQNSTPLSIQISSPTVLSYYSSYAMPFTCLKKFWKAISTGWVLEYPGDDGPVDLFDRKDRRPYGARPRDPNALERCGWRGEEARWHKP
jgi:hypothetical protein